MEYVLLSSAGNLIDSFEDEADARAALQRTFEADPEAAHDVAMLVYDEVGRPIGDPVFAEPTPTR